MVSKSTPRNRGKVLERWYAKYFSGKRSGPTGLDSPDVVSDELSIECKARSYVPKWITYNNAGDRRTNTHIDVIIGNWYLSTLDSYSEPGVFDGELEFIYGVPGWLLEMLEQTVDNARPNTVPVLVLHRQHDQHKDDLIFFRQEDLSKLLEVAHAT